MDRRFTFLRSRAIPGVGSRRSRAITRLSISPSPRQRVTDCFNPALPAARLDADSRQWVDFRPTTCKIESMTQFQRAGLMVCLLAVAASAQPKQTRKPEAPTSVINLTVL